MLTSQPGALPNHPYTDLWVGLVSRPSRISFRQMSQASTPAFGSITMALSRPRPRTCGRRGKGGWGGLDVTRA